MAAAIDQEVQEIVEAVAAAVEILTEHRAKLDAVADALLDRETLTREEFEPSWRGGNWKLGATEFQSPTPNLMHIKGKR